MTSLDSIDRQAIKASERAQAFLKRHGRGLSTAVVVCLAGFGATAFGIAPLAPDASDLPRQTVTESVTPEGLEAQIEALAQHELELYRSDLTRASDTADTLLQRLNVADAEAAGFLRNDPVARKVLAGRPGKMVQVRTDAAGRLDELTARYAAEQPEQFGTHFTRVRIERRDGVLGATVETVPLASQVRLGSGNISHSLFASTDEAHIPDTVAIQMAEIFATDIDFRRELRRGDSFTVLYEALTADGEPITWNQASGRVLAAEFLNDGKTYSAVWFKDPLTDAKGGYYDMNGQSKKRAFLASPMEFSRVTSGFSMRMHPIHKTWRQHKGVDYGAPTGTPVRVVGDGTVEFAGRQNGYGNVIVVRHNNNRSTLYAHLSRIFVKQGQKVEQGMHIGAVGATGWATGPHLHFEVKVNGVQHNPLTIAKSSETVPLAPESRPRFASLARSLKAQLEAAETMARTGAYAE